MVKCAGVRHKFQLVAVSLDDPNALPRFHQDDTNCRLYTWSSRPSAAFNFSLTSKKVKSEDPYRGIKILQFFNKNLTDWTGFKPTIVAKQPQNYLNLHL